MNFQIRGVQRPVTARWTRRHWRRWRPLRSHRQTYIHSFSQLCSPVRFRHFFFLDQRTNWSLYLTSLCSLFWEFILVSFSLLYAESFCWIHFFTEHRSSLKSLTPYSFDYFKTRFVFDSQYYASTQWLLKVSMPEMWRSFRTQGFILAMVWWCTQRRFNLSTCPIWISMTWSYATLYFSCLYNFVIFS